MREYNIMKQSEQNILAGFKRGRGSKKSSDSPLPDPIADTSGFIGGGIPNGQAGPMGTSGTF